ncbi:type IV secretion system DNA-binding domain-containing protein [Phenylobacterium sp. LH3H17]|uniref:type IV secretion system DNA-binding domain-containing protein n=1 Tax=Phenylobacterium sp. LH3H17 TaxID=2903901 RepID=UPI0020C96BE1|nr:type IV secretion system DNA-binding domain-containing protein [Phenylobacterium sp. LH3H17]UTP39771.1 type IV secretion system DNA-binding domain-containing protein [Phenylobacterium sp. LH3H17]
MAWNSNLGQWLSGGSRSREMEETRLAWEDSDRLWRNSPLATQTTYDRVLDLMVGVFSDLPRRPAGPVVQAICEATEDILRLENVGPIEPIWPAIEGDTAVAVDFRKMVARRRRYAADYTHIHGVVTDRLKDAYRAIFRALPLSCFGEWPEDGSAFEVPLIELVDDPAQFVQDLYLFAYDDDTFRLDLFRRLRDAYTRNILVASGFAPDANAVELTNRLIAPTRQKNKTPAELVELYLRGTPFAALLELPVPFHMPDEIRFEHTHIVGGTGHGKTQLLQRMIHADLVAAKDDGRSVVVIDSQGDLINKLVRLDLFDPDQPGSLWNRLVLVDPGDIEYPAALNLFDAHLDRVAEYRPVDRERVLNGVVELYETFFGDMLGAELTQKQGVVFRYLARLMVTIPGATIHTLMQIMEDGKPFKPYMERLEGSARYFFQTEFFHPSFAATKKQILRRLWGVLSTPAFERMFAQPKNKLDLFEATQAGSIVLISTAKDLLKRDGSALLGRFFINMLAQAALERSVVQPEDRTPTFVYVDEAHEYFDEGVETILQQARKFKIALVCAHQGMDQASPRLRSALLSNTSFKCVGGASAKDARALADELHTTPDFIDSMKRRNGRTEFAAWVKNLTPQAIRLSIPLGHLERQPTLSEEAYDGLIEMNRVRYCGTLDDVLRFGFAAGTPDEPEPPPRPAAVAEEPREAPPAPRERYEYRPMPEPPAVVEREEGKGGKKHRYLQNLVKGLAEQQGFRATVEAPMAGGGQVDVLLERDGISVAVEVSVTTPVEWERQNLNRCLAANYTRTALVLAKSQQTAKRYREAVVEGLSEDALTRLTILYPDDLPDFIASLAPAPAPEDNIVRGYRVKVSRTDVSPEEAKARRDTLARLVAKSLDQQDD